MAARSMSVAVTCILLSICFVAPRGNAQVEARQGDAKQVRPNDFTSPMVLELPLSDLSSLADGELVEYQNEIRDFFCDDVALRHFQIERQKTRGPDASTQVTFRVRGTLYVRPSHDREVALDITIGKGEEVVAETRLTEIEAEEKKRKAFKQRFVVSQSRLREAFSSEPVPTLRITMWVRDDI